MLDLGEANLMTVGSSVQETLCTRHHVGCFPCLSSNPADARRGPGCCCPHSADMDTEAERSGTLPRLTHPATQCELVLSEPGH